MPYVITQPCRDCQDNGCVLACPVNAIHPTGNDPRQVTTEQLYIDPISCIDCGACVPECPVEAIYRDDEVPEKWSEYTDINRRFFTEPPRDVA